MTRASLAVLLPLAILIGLPGAAFAEDCDGHGAGNTFIGVCEDQTEQPGTAETPNDPRDRGDVFKLGTTEVDGETCWMIVEGGTLSWDEAVDMLNDFHDNGTLHDACDFDGGTPPSVFTWWLEERCPPPPPTPLYLDPENGAITGKPGYLTIGGDRLVDIPCLGLTINAEARYVVRWGDGATTETTSQGGEWPEGDLTHIYQVKGNYTITVEAYWTGTVNGTSLPELPVPTTASQGVSVTEVQAVITDQH